MFGRKLTDLEEANLAFRGRSVLEEAKTLLKENLTTVNASPPSLTPEEQYCERILTEQLEEGMELLYAEAKEAFALNPEDATAQRQILQYEQWKRTKNHSVRSKSGLNITKGQRCKGQRNVGVWQRTKDFGWLLKVSGRNALGDIVNVRKKGGQTVPMKLTREVAPNYFRAEEV